MFTRALIYITIHSMPFIPAVSIGADMAQWHRQMMGVIRTARTDLRRGMVSTRDTLFSEDSEGKGHKQNQFIFYRFPATCHPIPKW